MSAERANNSARHLIKKPPGSEGPEEAFYIGVVDENRKAV